MNDEPDRIEEDGTRVFSDFCRALCDARSHLDEDSVVRFHRADCPDWKDNQKDCVCNPVIIGYYDLRTCEEIFAELGNMRVQ